MQTATISESTMKKEKYLFELIDNYLYILNIGSIVMENYLLEDRSSVTTEAANRLNSCLDFYDQLYEQLDESKYTEEEIDAILNYLVMVLKQETIKKIKEDLECITKKYIPEKADKFLKNNLYYDSKGNPQELNKEIIVKYIKKLRIEEMGGTKNELG